jgi:hypothetical protein
MLDAVSVGKVVHFEHRLDCNTGQFIYTMNKEQIDQAIDIIFAKERLDHEAFRVRCQGPNMVCDGLIFGITGSIFDKAVQSGIPEDRYDYIRAIGFCCSGTFVNIVDPPSLPMQDPNWRSLSKYPFGEHVINLLKPKKP